MGWDFTILGNSILAVALATILKSKGYTTLLITDERRLGNISLEPFRRDHLEILGVDLDRYSEACYTSVLTAGDEDYRLIHPIHICRTREVLEHAAAINDLQVAMGRIPPKLSASVVNCRPTNVGDLRASIMALRPVQKQSDPVISIHTSPNLTIKINMPSGSELLIQYGQPTNPNPSTILVQDYTLTASSQLLHQSIHRSHESNGCGLASPLGSSTAEILFARHLAETAEDPRGHQPSLRAVVESHLFIESLASGHSQPPASLQRLLKAAVNV